MKEMTNGVEPMISLACIIVCVGICFIDGFAPMDVLGIAIGYQD